MTDFREFPTAVIASISTGISLCRFGEMHEAAEFLMGHPTWTHHFASKDLWQSMQAAVLAQCPRFPTAADGVNPENVQDKIAEIVAQHGPTQTIRRGCPRRSLERGDRGAANAACTAYDGWSAAIRIRDLKRNVEK